MFKKFVEWLVYSSKNVEAENISMTFTGLFSILVFLGISDATTLAGLKDTFVNVVLQGAQVISGIFAVYGFVRKIYLTFKK